MMNKLGILFVLALTCMACSTDQAKQLEAYDNACEAPRPMICTLDYRPVCALKEDGTTATYSNGCSSCADGAVIAYRDGACEDMPLQ